MTVQATSGKPAGVYLAVLYFVVAGFLDSIQKFREWGSTATFNPLGDRSVWHLGLNVLLYLGVAYLLWRLTRTGRLLALVYGYVVLCSYLLALALYWSGKELNWPPLFVPLTLSHVVALALVLIYLQPSSKRGLFEVSLLEVLLPED